MIDRRRFIGAGLVLGLGACSGSGAPTASSAPGTSRPADDTTTSAATPPTTTPATSPETVPTTTMAPHRPELGVAPFGLGVASGDPTDTAVVLWTRLVDGAAGNPVADGPVDVDWLVAEDVAMTRPVRSGTATTDASLGHSVHVDVGDLDSGRTWYYRFTLGDDHSPIGRTRTLGPAGSTRIVLASCQHYEDGWFGAWSHAVGEDPALVVHVGDAIYGRAGVGPPVRSHASGRPTTLDEFRRRYALYWADPDLQAAHGALAWCAVWDDNEFASNHAGAEPSLPSEVVAAARRAWWEHHPVRTPPPGSGELVIDRRIELGPATLWLLDGRQHRSGQVCSPLQGLPATERCPAVDDDSRTMLGARQEAQLAEGLAAHGGRWQFLAQPTVVADYAIAVGDDVGINSDQWDGYAAARRRLLDAVGDADVVVLSGDLHVEAVNVLGDDRTGDVVAHEIVAPSITSAIDPVTALGLQLTIPALDHVRHFSTRHHGYVVLDVDEETVRATYRRVGTSTRDAAVETGPIASVGRGRTLLLS